jgi:hypothetical protein
VLAVQIWVRLQAQQEASARSVPARNVVANKSLFTRPSNSVQSLLRSGVGSRLARHHLSPCCASRIIGTRNCHLLLPGAQVLRTSATGE